MPIIVTVISPQLLAWENLEFVTTATGKSCSGLPLLIWVDHTFSVPVNPHAPFLNCERREWERFMLWRGRVCTGCHSMLGYKISVKLQFTPFSLYWLLLLPPSPLLLGLSFLPFRSLTISNKPPPSFSISLRVIRFCVHIPPVTFGRERKASSAVLLPA